MKNKAYLSCEYLTHTQKKNDENEIPKKMHVQEITVIQTATILKMLV